MAPHPHSFCPSRHLLPALILFLVWAASPTQSSELRTDNRAGIQMDRLALIGGGGATFRYLGFKYVDRAWYQGQKQDRIRWVNDWSGETYLNIDKAGHFMGGLFMAQGMNSAYSWAGFEPRTAAIMGTLTSWAALLEIEMRDARFDQWGFSIPDFTANTLGASVPLMYALFPETQVFRFKFSYFPSALYRNREARKAADRPHFDHVIDDYEGMTFWMSVSVNELLSGKAQEVWPDPLGVALGYGAVGMHGSNAKSTGPNRLYPELPDARPEIFFALDYDAKYLPGEGSIWEVIKSQLSWVHLPAPTIRLYPEIRFYLLYM